MRRIHDEILAAELGRTPWGPAFAMFQRIHPRHFEGSRAECAVAEHVMSALVRFPGPDWAPVIRYRNHGGPSARPSRLPHVICAPSPGNFSISHHEK